MGNRNRLILSIALAAAFVLLVLIVFAVRGGGSTADDGSASTTASDTEAGTTSSPADAEAEVSSALGESGALSTAEPAARERSGTRAPPADGPAAQEALRNTDGARPREMDAVEAARDQETISLPAILLLVLVLALGLNVVVSVILFRSRMRVADGTAVVVPEVFSEQLRRTEEAVGSASAALEARMEELSGQHASVLERVNTIEGVSQTLRGVIDEQASQMKQLSIGYEAHVLKGFLRKFIRVGEHAAELQEEHPESEGPLGNVRLLLRDALEEAGVDEREPEIGADWRKEPLVTDVTVYAPTDDPEQDGRISRVISPAYVLEGPAQEEILLPAKIEVHRHETGTEG